MDNYMFGAASNARNFLMQPQLERERAEDRTRRNAMADWQFQQAQAQAQAQAEAQRRARERSQRDAQVYGQYYGLPGRAQQGAFDGLMGTPPVRPAQPTAGAPAPMGGPPAPLQGGAPAMTTARPGMVEQIDPATGQPVGVVTVTGQGMQRTQPWEGLRQAPEAELNQRRLAAAWMAQDWEQVNELAPLVRSAMTEEEKRGRQLIGAAAAQILQRPAEERPALVRLALQQFGIDPASTGIDDITDPAQLEQALRFEIALGAPEASLEENIRVQGTRDEFRRPEMVDQGNQRALVSMSGTNPGAVLGTFQVQADPNAVLSAQTQRRGQDMTFRIGQINAGLRQLEIERQTANDARRAEIDREELALKQEAQDLTRQWMQGGGSGPAPGTAGITWSGGN